MRLVRRAELLRGLCVMNIGGGVSADDGSADALVVIGQWRRTHTHDSQKTKKRKGAPLTRARALSPFLSLSHAAPAGSSYS